MAGYAYSISRTVVDPKNPGPGEGLPVVAAFDFDGTLTWCDSLLPFLRHAVGPARFWSGLRRLSPVLLALRLGRLPAQQAKQAVLAHFLAGWSGERLAAAADRFAGGPLPRLVNPRALARLHWHRDQGHRVLIVSASPEIYLHPWAARHGVEAVLGTRLEMSGGVFTGRILGNNCHGPEKVARLGGHLGALDGFAIHAYGDSAGDRELLAAAAAGFYRPFRSRLPARASVTFLRALLG